MQARNKSPSSAMPLLVFLCTLLVQFALVLVDFANHVSWPEDADFSFKVIVLNRFLSDFFLFCALILLLLWRGFLFRCSAIITLIMFALVYFIQTESYHLAGRFLPLVALENMAHANFLDTNSLLLSGFIWLSILMIAVLCILQVSKRPPSLFFRFCVVFVLLLLAMAFKNDKGWVNDDLLAKRTLFYSSGDHGFYHVSPTQDLVVTLNNGIAFLRKQNSPEFASKVEWASRLKLAMNSQASEFAHQHVKTLGEVDVRYPLLHKMSFESPIDLLPNLKQNKKYNLIVFFVEGMSARVIQPYSDLFPNISPNILEFSKQAIKINNYYNHTYATYRGLGGQLCSIFPNGTLLASTNYYCLPHILKKEGYRTQFIFSQRSQDTDLDEVFYRSGFDEVDDYQSLAALLSIDAGERRWSTDKELFSGLVKQLKNSKQQQPFFIGLYNLQTHTGFKLNSNAVKYENPTWPSSALLDTFHNLDSAFGDFWRYFKSSPYYQDTIVILTSDHATFASPSYKALIKNDGDKTPFFIDTVPFLIYHPELREQIEYDAKSVSTVNFAPSVLHLLGVKNQITAFVGHSIFDANYRFPPLMTAANVRMRTDYKTSAGWHVINDKDRGKSTNANHHAGTLQQFEFLSYLQELERLNRIWPSDTMRQ